MAKQLQLSIPTPCHEDWDEMTPVDRGKFCGSCQKQVVDFSNMSDCQVAEFFKKPSTGSVCGRFMNDQLDRSIEIPKKRIPWVKYFFQFALPAFLVSIKASGQKTQGKPKVNNVKSLNKTNCQIPEIMGDIMVARICSKPLMGDTVIIQQPDTSKARLSITEVPAPENQLSGVVGIIAIQREIVSDIKGKIIDENGQSLAGATIIIKGTRIGTSTDVNGEFLIHPASKWEKVVLVSSSVGFVSKEIILDRKNYAEDVVVNIEAARMNYQLMGAVVVTKRHARRSTKPIPIIPDIPGKTIPAVFKIFPNPVPSGSNLTIEWKQTEEGYYTLQLLNQSGQSVHQQEIWIDKEARLLNIAAPPVEAGSYFLVVTNKKLGKKFTEKIIIQ